MLTRARPHLLAVITFALVLGLATPLRADVVTSSIDVSGSRFTGTITITATAGNQAILVHRCTRGGLFGPNDEGICVTDGNGAKTEVFSLRTVDGSGDCRAKPDVSHSVFCEEAESGDYTKVVASLDAFDDSLEMRPNLALTVDGGSGNDTITAAGGDDVLRGGSFDDVLDGGDGNDTLNGELGDDTLSGGGGDDGFKFEPGRNTFTGGSGDADRIDYGGSSDPVTVTVGATRNDGPAGDDNVDASIERVIGTSGADSLTGDGDNDVLDGRGGIDALNGLDGDDLFPGGPGTEADRDQIQGGPGADVVTYTHRSAVITANLAADPPRGGDATERDLLRDIEGVSGGSGADTLEGNELGNVLTGGPGGDTLRGQGGQDVLNGDAGNDLLQGGGGNDSLSADDGADTIDGGERGQDEISYFARTGPVVIDLTNAGPSGSGTGSTGRPDGSEGDRITNVENAQGTLEGDIITGNDDSNRIVGDAGEGNSTSFLGKPDFIDGAGGNDTIFGNAGEDFLQDGTGQDVVHSGPDQDIIFSQDAENDRIDGAGGGNVIAFQTPAGVDLDLAADTAKVGDSTDVILGGFTQIVGSDFNDVLRGDDTAQEIQGGIGDDQLFGRGGDDRLLGGTGKDQHDGGLGSDLIDGGVEPNDIVDYSEATTPVTVSFDGVRDDGRAGENDLLVGIENVWGGASDDTIVGGPENNVLYGNPGNDLVRGLGGNDTITGGAGEDTLEGADGNDTMEAADSTADGVNCGTGDDTITADPIDVLDGSCEAGATFIVSPAEPAPEGTPPAPGNQPLGGGVDPGPTPAPEDDRFVGVQIGTQNAGPPTVTGFSASPRRFRRRKGATFSYSTNEAGAANVKLERIETGRRKGNRCVKTTRKNRKRRKCQRVVAAGTVSGVAAVGANQLRMSSAVRRALRPGRHRAILTVSDPAGLKSAPLTLTLTVRR